MFNPDRVSSPENYKWRWDPKGNHCVEKNGNHSNLKLLSQIEKPPLKIANVL
jgi:hypothetical protein